MFTSSRASVAADHARSSELARSSLRKSNLGLQTCYSLLKVGSLFTYLQRNVSGNASDTAHSSGPGCTFSGHHPMMAPSLVQVAVEE